ncbi:hypothetical protein Acr_05g0002060 [Actinidia rufa]|uniref:Uncharacterized protein n=1 Tax=Actinidia rufa TaxID=165716 RepID=A0A7J0ELY5_9ERIC|nr:hypothetical protein Acr_05g0002060 [Actinidia rufa]
MKCNTTTANIVQIPQSFKSMEVASRLFELEGGYVDGSIIFTESEHGLQRTAKFGDRELGCDRLDEAARRLCKVGFIWRLRGDNCDIQVQDLQNTRGCFLEFGVRSDDKWRIICFPEAQGTMDCKDVDKVFKKLVVDSRKYPKSRPNTFLEVEGCCGGRRSQYRSITVAHKGS